jgi:hypothetical protein
MFLVVDTRIIIDNEISLLHLDDWVDVLISFFMLKSVAVIETSDEKSKR